MTDLETKDCKQNQNNDNVDRQASAVDLFSFSHFSSIWSKNPFTDQIVTALFYPVLSLQCSYRSFQEDEEES